MNSIIEQIRPDEASPEGLCQGGADGASASIQFESNS
jgi:hypothetical protein